MAKKKEMKKKKAVAKTAKVAKRGPGRPKKSCLV